MSAALGELVAGLAAGRDREQRRRVQGLVERLATQAAAGLRAELERLLERSAGDPFARDCFARVLAGACGAAALPALLRACVHDRNDDGETLQLDVLELLAAWPGEGLAQVLACAGARDPGLRRVGMWGLGVVDLRHRAEHLPLVVAGASDADPGVRAGALTTLGSIFGAGDPRARAALLAGTRDADPGVRRSAVDGLHAWPGEEVTEVLIACAGDADRWVRAATAWTLCRRPGAGAALERLAADDDPDVRAAARDSQALRNSTTTARQRASGAPGHQGS